MNNKRRTITVTIILVALSLTGIAAFAMTHRTIEKGAGPRDFGAIAGY